jgi:hypothetical protein
VTRLVDRLRARAAERFVGRAAELALIGQSLSAEPPPVAVFVVHGPGGVGKTSLLERVRGLAAEHGIDSLRLDARDVEPTAAGLLRALGAALGVEGEPTLQRVLAACEAAPRRLVLIDTFECLAHLEGWLRDAVLPELPDATRVILCGRATPDAAWATDPLWREGARVVVLHNLAPLECDRYLAARGIGGEAARQLAALSHGHPLALTLLADIAAASGEVPQGLGTDVVRQLAARFTAQVPDELHRRALEVCAHARVTTEALLADAVDRDAARGLFDWLASLSFVERGPAGLFPHDLVRDAIDDELHWRHRERHREIHMAVRRHLIAQVTHDARSAFDVMFLHRHSDAMQPFVDFRALGSLYFEPATADDLPLLRSLVRGQLPAAQHAQVERWFSHRATLAWAVRPAPRKLAAATLSIDLAQLTDAERHADPMFAAVWQALQRVAPPRPGDRQLLARWNVVEGGQRQASAAMNAVELSQFFQWLTLPRLGAFVISPEHPDHWQPMMSHIGFARLAGCDLVVDGVPMGAYVHDWRAEPVARWLDTMAGRELGAAAPAADAGGAPALAPADLERAVRDALRLFPDAAALAASPLAACAAVRAAVRDSETPGQTVQRVLLDAARAMADRPRDAKFWRALELTYFRPVGSQELAAERLGLPFGTYRYQLATGIERLVQALGRTPPAA